MSDFLDPYEYFKKMQAEQRRETPEPAEDAFRTALGATPGKPLAPVVELMRAYIDGSRPLSSEEARAAADFGMRLSQQYGSPPPQASPRVDREHFRQFAAGVQYAYEQLPWPADRNVTFHIDTNPQFTHPAYMRVQKRADVAVHGPEDIRAQLSLTASGVATLRFMERYGRTITRQYPDGPRTYGASAEAFRLGVEEGRHLAQQLVPEAFAKQHRQERPESVLAYEEVSDMAKTLAKHAQNPMEDESREFEQLHADNILQRSAALAAIPLPGGSPSAGRG